MGETTGGAALLRLLRSQVVAGLLMGAACLGYAQTATTTTLAVSPNPGNDGQNTAMTATVVGNNPTGKVDFYDGANRLNSVTLVNGTASASRTLAIGSHSLTARYVGDASNAASTSSVVVLTVNPIPVTITLTATANPSTYGSSASFTAQISGNRSLDGTVTFFDGGASLGSKPVSNTGSNANINFSTNTLSAGIHPNVTATYSGDPNNGTNTSAAISQTVNKASSTTNLNVSPGLGDRFGDPVTLTATISREGIPTGAVTFLDGAAAIGTANVDSNRRATLVTSTLSVGTHTLSASYAGDSNVLGSTSSGVSETIDSANTNTTISSSKNPSDPGETVTFTAVVTGQSPTGTVNFKDGTATLGSAALTNGVATFSTASLATGSHPVKASYVGDSNNKGSNSNQTDQIVRTATTTTLSSSLNPADVGQSVTFTATVTGSTPSGTVSFRDNGTQMPSGAVTLAGAGNTRTATYTTSALTAGSHAITAVYQGNSDNAVSTSPVVTELIGSPTTTTLASSANPSSYGQLITLTATVTGAAPGGIATFSEGGTTLGSASLATTGNSGTAAISLSTLSVASHTIVASYSGDSVNRPSSANLSQTVGAAATTTSVTTSPNPSQYAQAVTLTATVAGVNPTGSVTFKDGATVLGTASLSSGAASLSTTALVVGAHNTITAAYAGDGNNQGSTGTAPAHVVNVRATSMSLASNANPSTFGQSVTWTATVSGASPTGTVTFSEGSTTLGAATISNGVAAFTTSDLGGGTHSITASYAGDGNNGASTSGLTQAVNAIATITSLSSSLNPAIYGQNVTFTATVSGSNPTGTVTFKDGATTLGTATLGSGSATYSTSALSTGGHDITAVYGGDANNATSTSSVVNQAVSAVSTTTTVASSLNPSTYGQSVTWTATVSGGSSPSGTVTFKDGAATLGTAPLSGGAASFSSNALAGGSHSITASYGGDTNNAASTSAVLTQTVNAGATTTALTSSANPAGFGASVTLTAAVSGSSPSGTVTFKDGAATLGTAALAGGSASYTTSTLSSGSHSLTAQYGGDANNAASTSSALTQTISTLATTISIASSANPSSTGQSVTFTATVSGGSNPGGTVSFLDGATPLGTAQLASGSASFTTGALTAGSHSITAAYAGDTNNAGSTSPAFAQTVNSTASTVAFSVTPSSANPGDNVTLSASVTGNSPTGTVTFSEGATTLGQAALSSGSASLTLNNLSAGNHALTASYAGDANNQPSSANASLLITSRGPYTWQYGYDALGRLNTQVDPNNLGTFFYYDSLGRPIQTQQPAGPGAGGPTLIGFGWDLQDNLTSVTDPRDLSTTYMPDGLGNVKAETSPDRGESSYTFDANGNVLTATDARGKLTTYTYDELNRLKTISYTAGVGTTFEYDGGAAKPANEAGELTKITDESGSTTYAHDALGRLIAKTTVIAGRTFIVTYTWGDSGSSLDKLTSITYPGGNRVNYGYDASGFVSGITVTAIGGSTQTLLSNVSYSADSKVTGWQWSDGKARTIGYDSIGMIGSYTLGDPTGSGTTRTLTRDSAGRITGYVHGNGQSSLDQGFAYDPLNRLTSQTVTGTSYGYTYDATGNRTSKTIGGTTYTNTVASNSNRLTQTQDATGSANVQYDNAGSVTSDGTNTYAYSDRGRMNSATTGAGTVSFLYNGLQQRAYKTSSLGTSYYVYDEAGQLLGEYDSNGNSVYETIYLGSTPAGVLKTSGGATAIYSVYADQIGTPRVITKQDHTFVWRWDTAEAFGATAPNQDPSGLGGFVFNQRFPGQVFDVETGLNQNWNREYNARIGRYIQFDPIGLRGGVNGFSYVKGNPLGFADPNGLQPVAPGTYLPRGPVITGPPTMATNNGIGTTQSIMNQFTNMPNPSPVLPGDYVGINFPWMAQDLPFIPQPGKPYCVVTCGAVDTGDACKVPKGLPVPNMSTPGGQQCTSVCYDHAIGPR